MSADDPGRLELQKSEIAAAIRETESMASLADQLMGTALAAEARGNTRGSRFIGMWVGPLLTMGVYNKLVKTFGAR